MARRGRRAYNPSSSFDRYNLTMRKTLWEHLFYLYKNNEDFNGLGEMVESIILDWGEQNGYDFNSPTDSLDFIHHRKNSEEE